MKARVNEYLLTDPKVKYNQTILNASDFHGNIKQLQMVYKIVTEMNPDYVCIPGDLFDTSDIDSTKLIEIIEIITRMRKIAPVIISLGNHDQEIYDKEQKKWITYHNQNLYDTVDTLANVFYLSDEFQIGKDIPGYIKFSAANPPDKLFLEQKERKEAFQKFISKLPTEQIDSNDLNYLLSHTPNGFLKDNQLIQDQNADFLSKYTLITCGHNHGGFVPVRIQDSRRLQNNKGFISPGKREDTDHAFGYWTSNNTSLLLSNGITKLAPSSVFGNNTISNLSTHFFIPDVELVTLSQGDTHSLKLTKRQKKTIT